MYLGDEELWFESRVITGSKNSSNRGAMDTV